MHFPIQSSPCWNQQNPKAAITDATGAVIAFATASTPAQAEINAAEIVAALNLYLVSDAEKLRRSLLS